MSEPHPEYLILLVTLLALALAPLASHLVKLVGGQISSELDGGLTGEALNRHLDENYDGTMRDDEITQMIEASAFLRGEPVPDDIDAEVQRIRADQARRAHPNVDPELVEEVRQIVVAANESRERTGREPLNVEAETARRLAEILQANGHARN